MTATHTISQNKFFIGASTAAESVSDADYMAAVSQNSAENAIRRMTHIQAVAYIDGSSLCDAPRIGSFSRFRDTALGPWLYNAGDILQREDLAAAIDSIHIVTQDMYGIAFAQTLQALEALRRHFPDIPITGFSAPKILEICAMERFTPDQALRDLKSAGLTYISGSGLTFGKTTGVYETLELADWLELHRAAKSAGLHSFAALPFESRVGAANVMEHIAQNIITLAEIQADERLFAGIAARRVWRGAVGQAPSEAAVIPIVRLLREQFGWETAITCNFQELGAAGTYAAVYAGANMIMAAFETVESAKQLFV